MKYFSSTTRFALLALVLPLAASAQRVAATYTLTSGGGGAASYAALAPNAMPATRTAGTFDEGYYNNIPLGFSFNFGGVAFTTVSASTNGFLTLGQALTSATPSNNLTSGQPRPVIAPLWDDISFGAPAVPADPATDGNLYYQTTGSAGSRVFTIEWRNVRWAPGATGPVLSMLVQLTEGSNVVVFDYLQGALSAYGSTRSASVGFAGAASGDFVSLSDLALLATASSTTETTSVASRATSGRKFTFTPMGLATHSAEAQATFQLAPNPATAEVRVLGNAARLPVLLFDGTGRLLRSQSGATEAVDLRGLASGLYLVRVGLSSRRLVVK